MRIAITGASGFIGSELLAVLKDKESIEIIALTRDLFCHSDKGCCEWIETDYSYGSLLKALDGTDAVIHLAGVRGTENDPEKFAINEEVTENILKAMRSSGARRIVFASTVSVYDDEDLIPWTEDTPLMGRTAYGTSKIACEKLIREYSVKYGFSYGIARIAQVLGEGEKRRGMMNVFLDTAREHGTLRVMGKSIMKRQYIYVKDLAQILAALACGNKHFDGVESITVNAGMQDAYTNLEIAEIVNKVFGNLTQIDYDDSYSERGRSFCMDIGRLKNKLGYFPLDMEEAIREMSCDH